jgi:hypothetical protein
MEQIKLSPALVALLTGIKNNYGNSCNEILTNKQRLDLYLVELYGPVEERSYVDTIIITTNAWYEACKIGQLQIEGGGGITTLLRVMVPLNLNNRSNLKVVDFYEDLLGKMYNQLLLTNIGWCRDQLPDLKK